MSLPWEQQSPDVGRAVIPSFVCPSDSIPNLVTAPFPAVQMFAIGDTLGTTTYLYCRGAAHFWCLNPQSIPASVRGMFDRNTVVRIRDVTDGSTNTIAMGEGAAGGRYRICQDAGCTTPYSNSANLPGSNDTPVQAWLARIIHTPPWEVTSESVGRSLSVA